MKKILFCFGTRPEAIKMAPLIEEGLNRGHDVKVCITGQHRDMIIPFLEFFQIKVDYSLDIMRENQTLSSLTSNLLSKIEIVLKDFQPELVFVQGDTTSTFTCALAAFYQKIDVVHIEAGLRTGDIYSPFPEEGNRRLVTPIAKYLFAPTEESRANLLEEGVTENVVVTGNTSIDTLRKTITKIRSGQLNDSLRERYKDINFKKKIVLVTVHRRENHGQPLIQICNAIKELASSREDIEFVIPVHLNPNVKECIHASLEQFDNVHLYKPLEYIDFSWLMYMSYLIMTDSGGVQEEGPYFEKPILVMRENTERPEGVSEGVSKLIGSDSKLIINEVNKLFDSCEYYSSFSKNKNPYGDGFASEKVFDYLG
ncbi:non-hydrolyzing UDP-N-acetylglucosamine 2-epimerase [Halobacteriovorax sp. DPLXC-1]|uniref:non-hydrolyzing UDP-N-acetylglucosamine 2-epimerase n=1 Tax=Halobacteriovorax sp. DPLXC-1 TaxID=3110771 RepID=UPI002FEF90F5